MGLLLESLLQRINGASPGEFASGLLLESLLVGFCWRVCYRELMGLLLESLLQRINGASPGEFATEN